MPYLFAASLVQFFSMTAQVIPVLLLAILVDGNRTLQQPDTTEKARAAAKRSRRIIGAIIAGGLGEGMSLYSVVITSPGTQQVRNSSSYGRLWATVVVLAILFYVLILPHLEHHAAMLLRYRTTYRAWYWWAWLVPIGLLTAGVVDFTSCPPQRVCSPPGGLTALAFWAGLALFAAGILVAVGLVSRIKSRLSHTKDESD